ncbi:MAG: RNA-directed DNA polymerase [Lentilitoribacter sp.]
MIELGQIKIDSAVLERQLKHDLKDDWFPDSIYFKDYFGTGKISELIQQNFEANHGDYLPNKRKVANIPKPDFTIRSALEIGIIDRAVYHGICSKLCEYLDDQIPWFVFSHRRSDSTQNIRYMFRRGIPAWVDFLGTVKAAMSPGCFLLSTDLTNYFDNIQIDKLKFELNALIPDLKQSAAVKNEIRAYIDFLFKCLNLWTYEDTRGLPQNRDASSFLANVYMRRIDLNMRKEGYQFFRYMDDIKIVCNSEIEARKALQHLVVQLRQLGLAVNSKKTEMLEIADRQILENSVEEQSPTIRYLQSLWDTRKLPMIKRSFGPLKNITIQCLQNGDVVSREFRFAINRLVLLAGCKEIAVPEVYFEPITNLVIECLTKYPAPTDKYVSYLERVPLNDAQIDRLESFLTDDEYKIYDWQSYRIWALMGVRGIDRENLITAAVDKLDKGDSAERAGATLYLGAHGNLDQKKKIAENFGTLTSFFGQRAALLGMQDVKFNQGVKQNVLGKVRSDLHDVYRKANTEKIGQFAKPEPFSITQIIDTERDYA